MKQFITEDFADLMGINVDRVQTEAEPLMVGLASDTPRPIGSDDMARLGELIESGAPVAPHVEEEAEQKYFRAFSLVKEYLTARREGLGAEVLARIEERMEKPKSLLEGVQAEAFERALQIVKADSDQEVWDLAEATIPKRHTDLVFRLGIQARDALSKKHFTDEAEDALKSAFIAVEHAAEGDRGALSKVVEEERKLQAMVREDTLPSAAFRHFEEAVYIAKQHSFTDIDTAREALGKQKGR